MKKTTLLMGLAFICSQMSFAQTINFSYTGAMQTYTVPPCVTSITVDVQGAQGGNGPVGCTSGTFEMGGTGGRTEATIPVTPGDVLYIYVGGAGANDNNTNAPGGFNGGGMGMLESAYTYYGGGGGGGASDIRLNGTALTDRIVVAGGGGGAGSDGCNCNGLAGGTGGGLIGNPGIPGTICMCNPSGQGGTQSVGGVKGDWGCSCDAQDGTLGQGGNSNSLSCGGPTGGGGGGGGFYGGGGGALGAGGGGSNYAIGTATGVVHSMGYRSGDGIVSITPVSGTPTPGAITGSLTLCENTTDTYSISAMPGATNYTWTVPGGTIINSGQGTTTISITAGSASGNIQVTATYTCGISSPSTIALTVNPAPAVVANASATTVCYGDMLTLTGSGATSYTWSGGVTDGVGFNTMLSDTYTVTGTDANGCSNIDVVSVTVNPLPIIVANASATQICMGNSVTLSGSGATSYSWTGGVFDAVPFSPTVTDTYTVIGTDANGCQSNDIVTVTVNTILIVSANATATTVCSGTPVTLTGSGSTSYTWTGNVIDGTPFNPVATDTYTVTGTDANGCQDTDVITVTVNNSPVVNLGADVIQCGGSVTLDALNSGSSYLWNNAATTQTITVSASGTFIVDVTNANGCVGSDTVIVTINADPTVTVSATSTTACLSDAPISLTGTPTGGIWSGPGVTGSTFSPSGAGVGVQNLTYGFTDANGCYAEGLITITVGACTGIATQSFENGIGVYPNPNNGTFTINSTSNVGQLVIEITDMQGRVVYSSIENNVQAGFSKQINLEKESAGIYLMHISANGKQQTNKISIQK